MTNRTRDLAIGLAAIGLVLLVSSIGNGDAGAPPDAPTPTTQTTTAPSTADGDRSGLAALPVPSDGRTWLGTVVHVSDGDTLIARVDDPGQTDLRRGEEVRVRLLRIDTAEVGRDGDPDECWAQQARRALELLTPEGTSATFQYDVEPQDQYGRELTHVWNDQGQWVNGELLLAGHAEVVTFRPNVDHDDLVRQLEVAAIDAGAGRWGAC